MSIFIQFYQKRNATRQGGLVIGLTSAEIFISIYVCTCAYFSDTKSQIAKKSFLGKTLLG